MFSPIFFKKLTKCYLIFVLIFKIEKKNLLDQWMISFLFRLLKTILESNWWKKYWLKHVKWQKLVSAKSRARVSRDLNQLFCFAKLGCLFARILVCFPLIWKSRKYFLYTISLKIRNKMFNFWQYFKLILIDKYRVWRLKSFSSLFYLAICSFWDDIYL